MTRVHVVIVVVCFPTPLSSSVASLFRRMLLGVFLLRWYAFLSHEKGWGIMRFRLCSPCFGAWFVLTWLMSMDISTSLRRLLRFGSVYYWPLSNIFGFLIWCHILCVFDFVCNSLHSHSFYFKTRNIKKHAIRLLLVCRMVRLKDYSELCFEEEWPWSATLMCVYPCEPFS